MAEVEHHEASLLQSKRSHGLLSRQVWRSVQDLLAVYNTGAMETLKAGQTHENGAEGSEKAPSMALDYLGRAMELLESYEQERHKRILHVRGGSAHGQRDTADMPSVPHAEDDDPELDRKLMGFRCLTLSNLSCCYKSVGDLRKALHYAARALRFELGCPWVNPAGSHLNLCAILSAMGRHGSALLQAEAAVKAVCPYMLELESTIATKLEEGKISRGSLWDLVHSAAAAARREPRHAPVNANSTQHVPVIIGAWAASTPKQPQNDFNAAATAAERSAASKPSVPLVVIAYYNLAVEQEHLRRYNAAIKSYKRAVALATLVFGVSHSTTEVIKHHSDRIAERHAASQSHFPLPKRKAPAQQPRPSRANTAGSTKPPVASEERTPRANTAAPMRSAAGTGSMSARSGVSSAREQRDRPWRPRSAKPAWTVAGSPVQRRRPASLIRERTLQDDLRVDQVGQDSHADQNRLTEESTEERCENQLAANDRVSPSPRRSQSARAHRPQRTAQGRCTSARLGRKVSNPRARIPERKRRRLRRAYGVGRPTQKVNRHILRVSRYLATTLEPLVLHRDKAYMRHYYAVTHQRHPDDPREGHGLSGFLAECPPESESFVSPDGTPVFWVPSDAPRSQNHRQSSHSPPKLWSLRVGDERLSTTSSFSRSTGARQQSGSRASVHDSLKSSHSQPSDRERPASPSDANDTRPDSVHELPSVGLAPPQRAMRQQSVFSTYSTGSYPDWHNPIDADSAWAALDSPRSNMASPRSQAPGRTEGVRPPWMNKGQLPLPPRRDRFTSVISTYSAVPSSVHSLHSMASSDQWGADGTDTDEEAEHSTPSTHSRQLERKQSSGQQESRDVGKPRLQRPRTPRNARQSSSVRPMPALAELDLEG